MRLFSSLIENRKMFRHSSALPFLLALLLYLSPTTNSADVCPYDFSYSYRIIPPECYANATSIRSSALSPSQSLPTTTTPATTTSCCWFVFGSYLYVAIRYSNLSGIAFFPDPIATTCTSAFTSYLIREGLVSPSLLLSGQRCNLEGDTVKFVSGSRPCKYSNVSDIVADANLTSSRRLCSVGPEYLLTANQTACSKCQEAVNIATKDLLQITRSNEIVACGIAVTMGIWAKLLPGPLRFRSYALCMVQVLENVGNLGAANLFPSSSAPPTSVSSNSNGGDEFDSSPSKTKIVAATLASVVAAIFLFFTVLFFVYFAVRKRRYRRKLRSMTVDDDDDDDEETPTVMKSPLPTEGLYIFTKIELNQATDNYNPKLLLGEGGAGKVYLGKLPSGQNVAIKRFSKKKKFGEFYKEVEILAKLRHRNLATLLGYCLQEKEKDKDKEHVLVYEYIPCGNLSSALYHGRLSWHHRVKIAIDIAEGLVYLHEFPEGAVIHRDVKPSNVLLMESGQAKLSDFGVSKIVPVEITHVSTEVKGTKGYLDPEYFLAGQVSESTDVYSYGIVLLELVTGLKSVVPTPSGGAESIVHTAHSVMTQAGEGDVDVSRIVDERLGEEWDLVTVTEVFKLAYRCVKPYKNERPRMKEVLTILKGVAAELDGPMGVVCKLTVDGQDNDFVDVDRSLPSGEGPSDGASCSFTSPSVHGWSW